MKLLIVIMRILFIALLCFLSKTFFPDLGIRNCAFHEHVAYFYLTNPDIFFFITPTCRKFRIYWVGQKVLSSFLLRCNGETSNEFLCQPNANSKSFRVCKQFNFFQCALTCMEIVNCICHCSSVVQ